MDRAPVHHATFPQIVLLSLAALLGLMWFGAFATGTPWLEASPYLILAGVFFAATLTVWGVQRSLRPPEPPLTGEVDEKQTRLPDGTDLLRPQGR